MLLCHLLEFSITDSPGFQRWFTDSKIVDAAGEPLRLYHGTSKDQDFRKFRIPGNGVWFTTSPTAASDYAEQNDSQGYSWDSGRPVPTHTASRVIPVYVRAVNPLRIEQLPDTLRRASNYRAAQRQWFNELRGDGHDALIIGNDTIVVLKDAGQIKSAIGNRAFNPAKANMTEASIPFGKPVNATGFTFGFEAEFIISEGFIYEQSMRDIEEDVADNGIRFLEDHFSMPRLDDAFSLWQEDHPDGTIEDMLSELGAKEFLEQVDAKVSGDARYDPETGGFAVHDKSQVDAFYDLTDRLGEDIGIYPDVFHEDHGRRKLLDAWYLEPDMTVKGEDYGDYDAELTSPVFDYATFLDELEQVLAWIGKYDQDWMYTNGSCGLHVNIGPPKSFDPIKFLVFAGEGWLAKLFPRSDSQSTQEVIGELRDKATFARNFESFVQGLEEQAKKINEKMFLVNFLPWFEGKKYVEVRAMGGKGYEKRIAEIKQHVDRLLTLFTIASDPQKYRQAYMRKVYRYFIAEAPDALKDADQTQAARMFLQYARSNRVPDWHVQRWLSNGRIVATPAMVFEWLVVMINANQTVPTTLLKLICREIGLKKSAVAKIPQKFPRSAKERYAKEIASTVQTMKMCAPP